MKFSIFCFDENDQPKEVDLKIIHLRTGENITANVVEGIGYGESIFKTAKFEEDCKSEVELGAYLADCNYYAYEIDFVNWLINYVDDFNKTSEDMEGLRDVLMDISEENLKKISKLVTDSDPNDTGMSFVDWIMQNTPDYIDYENERRDYVAWHKGVIDAIKKVIPVDQ